ncbi:PRC-barrel domain-containing protein [Actinoplanes solisilvae]|uniref:PRC-barrel domain-containing protein n=1 Tax=Actinoplanes solisilvae TaxID=2486853 RepID=UPI000FD810AF|nr:PRC-barrel domain-containing protein [Actinoplanes solisilvae]
MRLTEIDGRRVMAAGTAVTVGRVAGVVIDPRQGIVVALRVKGAPSGDTLRWADVSGIGADAVMVASPDAVGEAVDRTAEILGTKHEFVGKRLLTDTGSDLGLVIDVAFDEQDGAVTALHTEDGRIGDADLIGCGSYGVVVRRHA